MARYLITGASSGLGRAMSRTLVAQGHEVFGVARRENLLRELESELGKNFRHRTCDTADADQVRAAAETVLKDGFEPDVVILNAGINPEKVMAPFSLREYEEIFRTNTFGALAWVEAFLPRFLERGRGQFVGISSLAALRGDARWVAYSASKAALSRSFESFRGQYASRGVFFTTIHLCATETGLGSGVKSPFKIHEDEAVRRILAAAARHAESVTVPPLPRLILAGLSILPDALFSRLMLRSGALPPASLGTR